MKKLPKMYTPNGKRECERRRRQGLMTEPGTWRIIRTVDYLYKELTEDDSSTGGTT